MARFDQPSKINVVSVFLWLTLLAGAYAGIKFGPPYYREYKVKEVLDVVANRCRGSRVPQPEAVVEMARDAEKKIQALGVEDAAVRVQVNVSAQGVVVEASYREVVRHWFISRTTTLSFTPRIDRGRLGGF